MISRRLLFCSMRKFSRNIHNESARSSFADEYKSIHIPTNSFQKALLGIGSATMSIFDPHRGDMIACMGEATGADAIAYMLKQMEASTEGQQILKEEPRINSKIIDLEYLKNLPDNTVGKAYSDFLITNNVTPDARDPVRFVDDVRLAYVMQRYREVHDLFHTILGMKTNMLGEVTVKWVEAIQTRLPMCIGGALFGPMRLRPKHRALYIKHYLPWAIKTGYNTTFLMNIYFEKRWEQSLDDLYKEINLTPFSLPK